MSTPHTTNRFGYELIEMSQSDYMPFSPIIYIELQRPGIADGDANTGYLSPRLTTEEEIDRHVASLKEDLDDVCLQAKAALKKAKSSTLKIVTDRRQSQ